MLAKRRRLVISLLVGGILTSIVSLSPVVDMTSKVDIAFGEFFPNSAVAVSHDPIDITGDGEFTPENGVSSGSGTIEDPYIISNLAINAPSAEWAIKLTSTTKHCIIQNCIISGARSGIRLSNTANITINNCIVTNIIGRDGSNATLGATADWGETVYGILSLDCFSTNITQCRIEGLKGGDGGNGVSSNIENRCDGNDGGHALGISIFNMDQFWISDNIIRDITGGRGGEGKNGPDYTGLSGSGISGGDGGYGGYVNGIDAFYMNGLIYNNSISHLYAGRGGNGGDGGDPGSLSGTPGDGGNGALSGEIMGIEVNGMENLTLNFNTITHLYKAQAGDGGSIGMDTHATGFESSNCKGGNCLGAIGIYIIPVIRLEMTNNVITDIFSADPGKGGYTGNGYAPDGYVYSITGVSIQISLDGIISENIIMIPDPIAATGEIFALKLVIYINGSCYLNQFSNDYEFYEVFGIYNHPHYGNYWGNNPYIADIDPKDGICDTPIILDEGLGITDYAPLAFRLIDDEDSDGLTNLEEYKLQTNLFNGDTDGDMLPDKWEVENKFDPLSEFNAGLDHDLDGLNLALEYYYGTNYLDADTDGDGIEDGSEILQGSDPLTSDSSETPDSGDSTDGESNKKIPGYPLLGLISVLSVTGISLYFKRK